MRPFLALVLALLVPVPALAAEIEGGAIDDRTGLIRAGALTEAPQARLAVRTPAGTWDRAARATRVDRDGAALTATVATEGGRTIELRMGRDAEGVVAVEASSPGAPAMSIGFTARRDERYLGFGERSNAVDQRGNDVEVFVGEGPYQPEERPFIAGFAPLAGYHPRDDATYFPIPWLLSTAGYGFLLDNSETSMFRLGARDVWSVEAPAARLAFRVFAGPTPARALERFTARTGRQPPVAAPWMLGAWWQPTPGGATETQQLDAQRKAGVPVSVVETFLHYLPCGDQLPDRAAVRRRTAAIHERGAAVLAYFNPMVCTDHPAYGEGTYMTDATGRPYVYRYSTTDTFVVSQIDFTAQAGRDFFGRLLREAVEDGFDGWMEDFGEYTPEDARSADGTPGAQMHNLYATLYHRAATEQTSAERVGRPGPSDNESREPPLRGIASYVRSGFTGTAPYARIVWGGDPTTDWGFDGLQSSVRNGLTMGLSGISTWGSDIGGFFSLGTRRLTPELFKRWIEFGAVSGVMRAKSKGIALPEKPRPQVEDPDVLPIWRRYARLRTRLYPYLVAADAEYQRTGMPMMRSFALLWPDDERLSGVDDAFLFGDDLLAAPVIRPGATERRVDLPPGEWVDLWRSADPGLTLSPPKVLQGGRAVTLPAPIDELPLLVRAGAILPLLPDTVDTLYRAPGLGDHVELRVFPRGWSTARPFGTDRIVSSERRGRRWVLRIRGERSRLYGVQAALGTLRTPFRPCRVVVRRRGRKFTYRDGVLRFAVRGRAVRAEVQGCRRKARRRQRAGVIRSASFEASDRWRTHGSPAPRVRMRADRPPPPDFRARR